MRGARLLGLGLALAGCGGPPPELDESWLRELQIVGITVDPPQVRPGVPVSIDLTVADPRNRGVDVLVWGCTDLGVGCFEQLLPDGSPRPVSQWAAVGTVVDDHFQVQLQPPSVPEILLDEAEDDEFSAVLWALACAPGVCDVIERVASDPAPGTEAWDVAARMLAWPDEWAEGLAPGWSSLAVKLVPIRSEVDGDNPEVIGIPERQTVTVGESGDFELVLTDQDVGGAGLEIEAFSTFGAVSAVMDGPAHAVVTWQAPQTPGAGHVYAVVRDGEGGLTVWRGEVLVLP